MTSVMPLVLVIQRELRRARLDGRPMTAAVGLEEFVSVQFDFDRCHANPAFRSDLREWPSVVDG